MSLRYGLACWLLASFACAPPWQALAGESPARTGGKIDFQRDIQPIFAKSCYVCHGAETNEGGLRLHRKTDALAGGDSGPVFKPGKSDGSKLIAYVTGENDGGVLMPPKGEGDKLSAEQVDLLRAWIDQGAAWPDDAVLSGPKNAHWSFQPVSRPALPTVKNQEWVRNGIDAFVLAKLESLGVSPSPEADRATLVRRLNLDLLGLPPAPGEVDAFVADQRPDAYERLVERLLASPHYGERWGRHWLDMARYADSDGYESDRSRPFAWRWRNWVIDAFNRDLPFDQFTIEQLAGDLLPNATIEQRVATGFHRNTLTNKEGGVDQEEFRVAATIDRVNTTGAVWLGLTVGCAQCHSHKYDPLAQREYYGLYAFFNSLVEKDISAPLASELEEYQRAREEFDKEHAPYLAAIEKFERDELPARLAAWEKTDPKLVDWHVLHPAEMLNTSTSRLEKLADGSILATGKLQDIDTYTFTFETDLKDITALRVEALADPSLPSGGPGRTNNGSFVLTEVRATAEPRDGKGKPQTIPLENATADFAEGRDGREFAAAKAIDGKGNTGWAIGPQYGQSHFAVFEFKEPLGHDGGTKLRIVLDQRFGGIQAIGRARIAVTTASKPVKAQPALEDAAKALAIAAEQRTKEQQETLLKFYRDVDPELAKLKQAAEEHWKKAPVDPGLTTKAQALMSMSKPRKTHVLIRGDFLRPGPEVEPFTPAVLPELHAASERPTRLDLARWLVDPANPLTSRVAVNRFWQRYFGRGLVATTEDFGTQGQPPSHPELLNWLASEFVSRGWSMKALHRMIVGSATYRQSSAARPDLAERDPQNVWLARQARFRVEAEIIRDLALAASGLLTPTIGGPSVKPPQPPGISELTYANAAKWVESTGSDRYRRGLYTHFQRTSPYPMLMTFDAPDSNICALRRERSNTPLQALTLLNDTTFVECAQGLAKRLLTETQPADPSQSPAAARLQRSFRLCLGRQPSAVEMQRLQQLHDDLLAACAAEPEEAAKLAGQAKCDGVDPAEAAAWVAVSRALMNLDEFVTRE